MDALLPQYDFVVVGGGSAGCVIARRLSDNSEASVLLIEAGPDDCGISEIERASAWTSLLRGPYDWGYDYAPAAPTAHRRIPIPRGRVLGGSSSINAMLWNRGHPSDYDAWEAAGATGWNFSSLLPYFKRAEAWEGGETPFRGASGPLRIERSKAPHPIALAMLEGAAELGLPVIDDHNGASMEGAALSNVNMAGQSRWSAARGYLSTAVARPNLTILTGSLAIGLCFEGPSCAAVRHVVAGYPVETRAASEVILALGAIDTPRLLMISGIGDPDQLKRLGVGVKAALPGVGCNLQDHPLLMGINFHAKAPLGPVRDNGGGALINWRSSAAREAPNLHAFVVQGVHAGPEVGATYDLSGDVFAISPGLMRSASVGGLRLLSAKPGAPMTIQPNFLAEPSDLDALVESIDTIMDLSETRAYRAIIDRPVSPNSRLTRQEKAEFVRLSCSTFFHACGTCAMGTGEMSVVDPSLRVHGVEKLRIADASVIPLIPSCNTHAPVTAIAERAADLIREAA